MLPAASTKVDGQRRTPERRGLAERSESGSVFSMRKDCTEILKALADKSRIRIVSALLAGPQSVNDLAEQLAVSQYNVSKHLRVLRYAGIVGVEPSGTHREYYIVSDVRERQKNAGKVLNFGCCRFRFDQLAD